MSWRASESFAALVGDDLYATAGLLDLLPRRAAERVGANGQLLRQVAAGQHLHGMAALRQAGVPQGLRRHLGAGVEPRLEVADVDGLGVRPEVLERHRHLVMRAA